MELMIAGKMREPEKVKHSQLAKVLPTQKPILIFGKSGEGKTDKIIAYAKESGKRLLIISLAMEMPETIGGIPYAKVDKETKVQYFVKLLDERLEPVIKDGGKDWIIFFDEINQGSPEVFNALYSICHPDPRQRQWNGYPLPDLQVVAAGNKDDGSDGTTYLNALPTPLLNRFFICELVADRKETMDYLKNKWKNIPQVAKYIDVLLSNDIPPRDIDQCLEIIAYYEMDGLLLQMKIGSALTAKLYDLKQKVASKDPAEVFKLCREGYQIFKEHGYVKWASEQLRTEEEVLERFREILSEEEIQAIIKGE